MTMRPLIRCATPAVIGLTSVLLTSCGGSGSGLIPSADAGPLERDFEEVARLALSGNGSCSQTTEAIERTERDFAKISASIDAALRARLQEGITNLRNRALAQCANVTTSSSSTTSSKSTVTSETTVTPTTTTASPSTSTTSAASTTSPAQHSEEPSGGGTRAPGEGAEEGRPEAGGGGATGNETGPGSPGSGAAGEIGNHGRGR
jgi:hypothetical protein